MNWSDHQFSLCHPPPPHSISLSYFYCFRCDRRRFKPREGINEDTNRMDLKFAKISVNIYRGLKQLYFWRWDCLLRCKCKCTLELQSRSLKGKRSSISAITESRGMIRRHQPIWIEHIWNLYTSNDISLRCEAPKTMRY